MSGQRTKLIAAGLAIAGCSLALWAQLSIEERQNLDRISTVTIVIDPGHGGADTGAVSRAITEKYATLIAGRQTAWIAARGGGKVILTRESDIDVSLEDRVAIANANGPGLLASIHVDSFEDATVSGARVYHPRCLTDEDAELGFSDRYAALAEWGRCRLSRLSASAVASRLEKVIGRPVPVHTASFRVLEESRQPAIIVELGFLSSPDDEANLRDPRWMEIVTEALAEGLGAAREILIKH